MVRQKTHLFCSQHCETIFIMSGLDGRLSHQHTSNIAPHVACPCKPFLPHPLTRISLLTGHYPLIPLLAHGPSHGRRSS
jgi:hypothetical protein